jgi:hypothetical protein
MEKTRKAIFTKIKNARANVTVIYLTVIIIIFVVTGILTVINCLDYSQMIATAGLLFAVAAFSAVILNLNATYKQLRKAMAKPEIKLAFNKNGEQQIIVNYDDKNIGGLPRLWLINEGNKITRFFQIDIKIPENIGNYDVNKYPHYTEYISFNKFDDHFILSYKNEGKYTLFVNKPHIISLWFLDKAIDLKKCIEIYIDQFILEYTVYGDWDESLGGKLKIILKKQEVTHVPSTG